MPQVNNPYTFNIKNNYKASADIKNTTVVAGKLLGPFSGNWTCPNNVKVVKAMAEHYDSGGEITLDAYVYCNTSKKYWTTNQHVTYVGVTPGKTYNIKVDYSSDNTFGFVETRASLEWSQSINNQTPNITDY